MNRGMPTTPTILQQRYAYYAYYTTIEVCLLRLLYYNRGMPTTPIAAIEVCLLRLLYYNRGMPTTPTTHTTLFALYNIFVPCIIFVFLVGAVGQDIPGARDWKLEGLSVHTPQAPLVSKTPPRSYRERERERERESLRERDSERCVGKKQRTGCTERERERERGCVCVCQRDRERER